MSLDLTKPEEQEFTIITREVVKRSYTVSATSQDEAMELWLDRGSGYPVQDLETIESEIVEVL